MTMSFPDIDVFMEKASPAQSIFKERIPGWPLENPPPVAGSKSPTLRWAERGVI